MTTFTFYGKNNREYYIRLFIKVLYHFFIYLIFSFQFRPTQWYVCHGRVIFVAKWICCLNMCVASQTGDADSSRAPGLTSGLQGSVNVHRGALLLVPQWQCISSFVFYLKWVSPITVHSSNPSQQIILINIPHRKKHVPFLKRFTLERENAKFHQS